MDNLFAKFNELKKLPDGLVASFTSPLHRVLVVKKDNQIQIYFADPKDILKPKISGIMSRIDLDNPLNLLGACQPAIILSLIWVPDPKNVYMIGFAGGRVPFVLHHYFPQVVVESTDIEPIVKEIAEKYFGVVFDARQKLFIKDGRKYLENQPPSKKYEIIIMDAFRGSGFTEKSLSSGDFFELCKDHLTEKGVICVNMIDIDPLFSSKVQVFKSCFRNVYLYEENGNNIFFGSDGLKLKPEEIQHRSMKLQSKYQFIPSLSEKSTKLVILK